MSLTLISTPNKIINTIDSNVAGVISQLPYKFKRVDFLSSSYDDNAGNQRVLLDPGLGNISSTFVAGDSIHIEGNSVIPDGSYTVDSIDFSVSTRLTLGIAHIFTGAEINNINLLTGSRFDYRVNLFIKNEDNTIFILDIPLAYQTRANGDLFVDLRDVILPLMALLDQLIYTVEYFESFDGVGGSVTATGNTQAIRAKSQAGDIGGSNEWQLLGVQGSTAAESKIIQVEEGIGGTIDIVIFNDEAANWTIGDIVDVITQDGSYKDVGVVTGISGTSVVAVDIPYRGVGTRGTLSAHLGSILTKFKQPLLWEGWRRTLTAVRDKNWDTRNNDATAQFSFLGADVNKVALNAAVVAGATTDVSIVTGTIAEEKKIEDNAYFVRAVVQTGSLVDMTKALYYKVELECQRPIYIEWVNSLGGLEQHLFSVNQDISIDSVLDVDFNTPITEDLEFALDQKKRIVIDSVQRLTVQAEKLTIDQYRALAEIKFSNRVYVYLVKDGSKRVRVRCTALTSSNYSTKGRGQAWSIVIEIEFPDNFDIHNVLDLTTDNRRPRVVLGNLIDADLDDLIDDDNDNLIG